MCTKHLNSQLKVLLSLLTHTHTHPLYKHSEEELLGLLGVYFIWNQSLSFLICNQAKDPSGLLGEEGAPMRGRNAASSPRGFINNSYGWVSSAKWRNGGKESTCSVSEFAASSRARYCGVFLTSLEGGLWVDVLHFSSWWFLFRWGLMSHIITASEIIGIIIMTLIEPLWSWFYSLVYMAEINHLKNSHFLCPPLVFYILL